MADGASAAEIAAIVFASDEYHRVRTDALFEQFMGRPADPSALAYFAGELDGLALQPQAAVREVLGRFNFFISHRDSHHAAPHRNLATCSGVSPRASRASCA